MSCYDRLEDSITHALVEEQVKLGYYPNAVTLYYPLESVLKMLELKSTDGLQEKLLEFEHFVEGRLGKVVVRNLGERYRFTIPAEGAEYVYQNCKDREFITKLITLVARHDISETDIISLFQECGENILIKEMQDEEFDFAVYSTSQKPDAYVYCFKKEGHHMTYHRFSIEDYKQYGYSL